MIPDIVTLNETGLRSRNKASIPGYITFTRNRKVKAMGGISTSVRDNLKHNAMNIKEGIDDDEYMITGLDHCTPALSVVNIYGEQECRVGREEIRDRWDRLCEDK